MNCPICKNEMVKARATNFGEDYDYCRTCKKELKELQAQPIYVEEVKAVVDDSMDQQLDLASVYFPNNLKVGDLVRYSPVRGTFRIISISIDGILARDPDTGCPIYVRY
jgi:hypothetical protein